jgi:hypothetical protein
MWLPLTNSLDSHHFGLLSLITLARPLIVIARVMTAGSCGVGNILQSPLFPVSYKFQSPLGCPSPPSAFPVPPRLCTEEELRQPVLWTR